jgi:hypothetical protein
MLQHSTCLLSWNNSSNTEPSTTGKGSYSRDAMMAGIRRSQVHCGFRSLSPGSSDPLEGESSTGVLEQVLSEI